MTELEQEQAPAPDDLPQADPVEQPGGPQDEPEPEPEPSTDEPLVEQPQEQAEQEAIYAKLDTKADNYFKGLKGLLEDSGIPLTLCELCANAYPGVRWVEPQDDPTRAMLGIIGATADASPLVDDPDAQLCDRCNGFGWTRLPSHVPNNTERMCRRCNGAGWLDTNPQSGTLQAPEPEPTNGASETLPGVPENDPSVVDLRARGYMVVPMPNFGETEPAQG